jgi:predicted phosphate transport protein (TIGR00153 family)
VDRAVLVLFASVIESLGWATAALLDQDVERAERVIADDRQIDNRSDELTGLIKARLSQATVEPDELEDLIAILQMVPELERSADLAEHIAQRTHQGLGGSISPRSRGLIQAMCDVGIGMWQLTSRAYAERSRESKYQLADADDELDELSASLVTTGAADGTDPAVAAELALIARFYERLGDHAVNLARRIDAMVASRRTSHLRRLARARRWPRSAGSDRLRGMRAVTSRVVRLRPAPRDDGFFELFHAAAVNSRDCADTLRKMIVSFSDLDDHYLAIRSMERRGDHLTRELLRLLDSSFVTPYDRQDIHALADALDDVVDDMLSAAGMIHLVHVDHALLEVSELVDILAVMAGEMEVLIRCLRHRDGARQRLEHIEALEHDGDAVYRRAIGHLFSGEFEPLEVIKWKDVVQSLENAVKRVEDVSDVVESILIKNG